MMLYIDKGGVESDPRQDECVVLKACLRSVCPGKYKLGNRVPIFTKDFKEQTHFFGTNS